MKIQRDCTDIEGMIQELIDKIQGNFAADWLKSSSAGYENSPMPPYSERSDLLAHMQPHINSYHEVCCPLDGPILLQVGSEIVCVEQGQLFIIRPGVYHNEMAIRGVTGYILWLCFTPDSVGLHVSGIDEDGVFQIKFVRNIKLEPIFVSLTLGDITKELDSKQYGSLELVKCYLLQLLLVIERELKLDRKPMTTEEWRESVVRDVIQYIESRQGNSVDLSEIVTHTNISVNHLNNVFKSVTGMTIMAYCNEVRIEQAKKMLTNSRLKIKDLAELLGYYDQYHFCNAFKKATGMSPTQYRKNSPRG